MRTRDIKVSPRRHTGQLLPHRHTSWGALSGLLVVVGGLLALQTRAIYQEKHEVLGDTVTVTAIVNGPPPSMPATIAKPIAGEHFSEAEIMVDGTCPANTIVQLYKNGIFAGSTFCQSGVYELQIALVGGVNQLSAKVIDNLNQYGPTSSTVEVVYDIPESTTATTPAPTSTPGLNSTPAIKTKPGIMSLPQLLITTDTQYQGAMPGKPFRFKYVIQGGEAPYAVNISWGDTTDTLATQMTDTTFYADHVYRDPGNYKILARVSDKRATTSLIQGVVVVQGEPKPLLTTGSVVNNFSDPSALSWILYAVVFGSVIIFWTGECYERYKLKHMIPRPKAKNYTS